MCLVKEPCLFDIVAQNFSSLFITQSELLKTSDRGFLNTVGKADNGGNQHLFFKTMFHIKDIPDFESHVIFGL